MANVETEQGTLEPHSPCWRKRKTTHVDTARRPGVSAGRVPLRSRALLRLSSLMPETGTEKPADSAGERCERRGHGVRKAGGGVRRGRGRRRGREEEEGREGGPCRPPAENQRHTPPRLRSLEPSGNVMMETETNTYILSQLSKAMSNFSGSSPGAHRSRLHPFSFH